MNGKKQVIELKNGMNVIFLPIFSHSTVIRLYVPIGSCADGEKKGIAHLAEHCMTDVLEKKINKKYKTTWVDHHVATHFDATTSRSYTCALFDTHASYTKDILNILSNVFALHITGDMLKHQKEIVVSEVRDLENEENHIIMGNISHAFGGVFAWKDGVLGNKNTVQNISLSDVQKFIQTEYIPNGSCLIISGNISDEIKKYAIKLFETKTKIPRNLVLCKENKKNKVIIKEHRFRLGVPGTQMRWLMPVYIDNEKENIVWEFIRFMLHDYVRFFLSKKTSLAYYTSAELDIERGAGMFLLSASVDKKQKQKALFVIKDALKHIKKYCTKEEFETVKEAFLYESLLDKDYPITQARNVGWITMMFGIDAVKKMNDEKIISNITYADVIKRIELFAKNHFLHITE